MKKFLICEICGKTTQTGYNRPKSQHKTKRLVQPNVQKWNGILICSRCRRTVVGQLNKTAPSAK